MTVTASSGPPLRRGTRHVPSRSLDMRDASHDWLHVAVVWLFLVAAPPTTATELFKLTANDRLDGRQFGYAVGLSGQRALIGAPWDTARGPSTGSAYLFDVTTGKQIAKLYPPVSSPNDSFGRSVAIDGDFALVGSASSGAYLFDATTGQFLRRLITSSFSPGDALGWDVALSGDRALVSARGEELPGNYRGSVYLMDIHTGHQVAKLNSPVPYEYFGGAVALDGDRILVRGSESDTKRVRVFGSPNRQYLGVLACPSCAYRNNYGDALAIDKDRALISDDFDATNGQDSGAVYVADVSTLTQSPKLLPSDGQEFDGFGRSVALQGNLAVIGAPGTDFNGNESGSAYVFDASTRLELARLLPSDGTPGDSFGWDVAVDGDLVLVGARLDNLGNIFSGLGSAYLFRVPEPEPMSCLLLWASVTMMRRRERPRSYRRAAGTSIGKRARR